MLINVFEQNIFLNMLLHKYQILTQRFTVSKVRGTQTIIPMFFQTFYIYFKYLSNKYPTIYYYWFILSI